MAELSGPVWWNLTACPLSRRYMAQSKHAEARELMRVSDPPVVYEPNLSSASAWAEAAARFRRLSRS